ncbi:MAG: Cof-type HAD-IIB family hydrolase [Firmicutes bacterium]|nr:Cof-type HAD-IIB family hydrolase [Bacillota bacterium]
MEINKNKYKMIVMDMDYTLLNAEKGVSPRNKEALRKAKEKGILLVVATGRIYVSARFYAGLLNIETPIIASNGAIIREGRTNKTIFKSILSSKVAIKMIELCREKGLFCHLFSDNTVFTEKIINVSSRYTKWNKILEEEDKINIKVVNSLEDAVKEEGNKIVKAVVVDSNENYLRYIRDNLNSMGMSSVSQSLKGNMEVMNKGVSKGNAIKILCELYDIDKNEVIAIGDNENDISMIEYAGMGVAMGNASDNVKEKADYVTGDYLEDGVAQAIEKFVL